MSSPLRDLPALPSQFGPYVVRGEIARGGMAVVYLADEGDPSRPLALKVPLPELATDERFLELFLDEATIAAELEHPNLVETYRVGQHEGRPYLAMEYVSGRSLAELLRLPADPEHVGLICAVLAEAARGLHAAHTSPRSVVHRDVSPDNILLGDDGRVKITDFGIAAARGKRCRTRTGELRGKLRYLAPEQITRDRAVGPRTDLWPFGVILWEYVQGRPLFEADSEATTLWNITTQEVPPLDLSWPEELRSLVSACLQRSPDRRPRAADELARTLDEVARRLCGSAPDRRARCLPAPPRPRAAPKPRLRRTRVGIARPTGLAVAGLLLMGTMLLAFRPPDEDARRAESGEAAPPATPATAAPALPAPALPATPTPEKAVLSTAAPTPTAAAPRRSTPSRRSTTRVASSAPPSPEPSSSVANHPSPAAKRPHAIPAAEPSPLMANPY